MPPLKNSVADHLVKTAQATHAGRDVFELASLLLTQLSARGTWPATWRPEPLAAALVYGAARLNGTVELTQDLAACAAGTSATTLRRYLALLAANLDVDFGLGSLQARPEDMLP
jgi:transcription initiation factor TFIIIB Brf1 subunit/transcription initiation factor TFIIB